MQARTEATLGTSSIAVALRLYQTEHGSYPPALDALPRGPVDPFSGRPYVYRREGAGFVLYSVGEDGIDQGASSEEMDIVFRISE
jgi:hypothetical protein